MSDTVAILVLLAYPAIGAAWWFLNRRIDRLHAARLVELERLLERWKDSVD